MPSRAMRVLIVDDNVDSAEMLSVLVGLHGHQTRTAHDGDAALQAYREFEPDLALLDIGLPGMNGYDVARELRRSGATSCRLVAITGWGQEDDRRRARAAGFDCHVTKPADPEVIIRLLDSVAAGTECEACHRCLQTSVDLSRCLDGAGSGRSSA